MRDWRGYVKERLGSLGPDAADAEDVAGELAGHLEEFYEALRAEGIPEEEAFLRTCVEAGNWGQLRRGVISTTREGRMIDRVKQIWIPSLLTLLTSWAVLAVLLWGGLRPLSWHRSERRGVILYVLWLLLLPLIGAVGGYLCRRARGAGWRAYLAGAFPVLAIAAIFAMIFPFAFFVDPRVVPGLDFASLAADTVNWVILPGIALCIGVALQGSFQLPTAVE